jgi:WD40 repeat protein
MRRCVCCTWPGWMRRPGARFCVSADQTVCLWDVASAARCMILSDHHNSVTTVAFSPDGALLANAGLDQVIHCGICASSACGGRCTGTPAGSDLSPSARTALLVSGSDDETVRLRDVNTGCCVDTLRTPGPYAGMNIAGATGLTEAQRSALKALGAVGR